MTGKNKTACRSGEGAGNAVWLPVFNYLRRYQRHENECRPNTAEFHPVKFNCSLCKEVWCKRHIHPFAANASRSSTIIFSFGLRASSSAVNGR